MEGPPGGIGQKNTWRSPKGDNTVRYLLCVWYVCCHWQCLSSSKVFVSLPHGSFAFIQPICLYSTCVSLGLYISRPVCLSACVSLGLCVSAYVSLGLCASWPVCLGLCVSRPVCLGLCVSWSMCLSACVSRPCLSTATGSSALILIRSLSLYHIVTLLLYSSKARRCPLCVHAFVVYILLAVM